MDSIRKIGLIIANELYLTYTDRSALLIMIVAPLMLATIIGMAFSGFSNGDVGFDPIPMVVVNEDVPLQLGDERVSLGDVFLQALVPDVAAGEGEIADNDLWQIVSATQMTDTASARALVDAGELVAVLEIPPDFTRQMMQDVAGVIAVEGGEGVAQAQGQAQSPRVVLYADPASDDLVGIVRGVISSIGNGMVSSNASVSAAIASLYGAAARDPLLAQQLTERLQQGALPFASLISTQTTEIPVSRQTAIGEEAAFNPFALLGSRQAVFFMLFTAMATSADLLRDKRNGILRRLFATPTPIASIVLGKIGVVIMTCATQVLLLLGALTAINAVSAGEFAWIFGSNIPALVVVVFAVAMAAAGWAMMFTSFVRTPEQAQAINSVLAMAMGLLSGAFFDLSAVSGMATVARFTINYWAIDAISRLSEGNNAIGLNIAVLLAVAAVTLAIAFARFQRTLEA